MTRSLVIAPQWIGDAVMSQPLIARLAARGERLTVAALPWVAPVYRAMPQIARNDAGHPHSGPTGTAGIIELPFAHGRLDLGARRRLARRLRGRFDAAYVLPNSLKSALIPWLAGIPERVGYHGESRFLLLNRRLVAPPPRTPMVAFYSGLAQSPRPPTRSVRPTGRAAHANANIHAHVIADDERPHLQLPAAEIEAATVAAEVRAGAYWVFAPGAEYGPAKRWPPTHFAALARTLHARDGQPVLLLGSAGEAALCERIAADSAGACRVLAGRTSLLQAMALIAGARGVVSNDSGLMHVAAAFGVPQAAVFGSTSPLHTPPLNPRAQVLWLKDELKLDCMPCFERVCRFGHTRCLTAVGAERVDAALSHALGAA